MASDEEAKPNPEENFEWNVENEIRLFEAMIGHKPVGINKHFHMACISEKFENLMGKPVSSDLIWKHLGNMFDLVALDKKESLPFPNEQEEFSLPEMEFSDLISEKLAAKTDLLSDTKESGKEVKTPKASKDSALAKESTVKKEKKYDADDSGSNADGEKKDAGESESEGKRGKAYKEEKPNKRRGNRSIKDKKSEEEISQSNKREEESQSSSGNKKEKQGVGKRSLRSRIDDSASNKSLTPPPTKRARRT